MPRRRAKDRRHIAAARSAASPESAGDGARQPAVDLAHAGSPRTQLAAREAAATNSDVDAELWEVLTTRGCHGCLRTRGCLQRNSIARIWEACYDVMSSISSSLHSGMTVWLSAQVLEICEDAELEEIHSILYGASSLAVGNQC